MRAATKEEDDDDFDSVNPNLIGGIRGADLLFSLPICGRATCISAVSIPSDVSDIVGVCVQTVQYPCHSVTINMYTQDLQLRQYDTRKSSLCLHA